VPDTEYLNEVLKIHLDSTIGKYAIAAALVLLAVAFMWIKKKKFDKHCLWGLSALIPLIILFCINGVPIMRDLSQQDYVTAEVGYYYRDPNGPSEYNWLKKSRVAVGIEENGEHQQLCLPLGAGVKDGYYFPRGKYTGTAVYAKRSEILLYFMPQSDSGEHLTETLKGHLDKAMVKYAIAAALVLLLVAVYWLREKKLDGYCLWMLSAFVVLIILFCMNVVPVISDLEQQDYVTAELGYYHRYPNGQSSHNWFAKSRVVVELDGSGKRQHLYLPSGNNTNDTDAFPMGKYTGTAVYAKRSRILLSFEPQSEIDE